MTPGVASGFARIVRVESVDNAPVVTDSSELDSVCCKDVDGSEESSCFVVSEDPLDATAAAAAARICCLCARAALIRRLMASIPAGLSRGGRLVTW
jgi:hypothetical protein